MIGNTFWGPDNKPYEVERVISNAGLDLVEAYSGTTTASTPYKINTTETVDWVLADNTIALVTAAQLRAAAREAVDEMVRIWVGTR